MPPWLRKKARQSRCGRTHSLARAIRTAPHHPNRKRISIAAATTAYKVSTAFEVRSASCGVRGARWLASTGADSSTRTGIGSADEVRSESGAASMMRTVRESPGVPMSTSAGSDGTASENGGATAGTQYGSTGIKSIANRTAVHDAWRTAPARTRRAASAPATRTAATGALMEVSASMRRNAPLISVSSPFSQAD